MSTFFFSMEMLLDTDPIMRVVNTTAIESELNNLTPNLLSEYREALEKVLIAYSEDPHSLPARTVTSMSYGSHLFMPAVSPTPGIKVVTGTDKGFQGFTVIMDKTGAPQGMVNAGALTSFRTALATLICLLQVFHTSEPIKSLAVFGSGPQAFWHVRLTLMTYPSIDQVFVWNRSKGSKRVTELIKSIKSHFPKILIKEMSKPELETPQCQIIFGCVPSNDPIIKSEWISANARVFVGLIGSYKSTMQEVGADIIERVSNILVDSSHAVSEEAGEIINNGVSSDCLLEIGAVLNGKSQDVFSQITANHLVLWKCVGLSIMDISVSEILLKHAKKYDFGTEVEF